MSKLEVAELAITKLVNNTKFTKKYPKYTYNYLFNILESSNYFKRQRSANPKKSVSKNKEEEEIRSCAYKMFVEEKLERNMDLKDILELWSETRNDKKKLRVYEERVKINNTAN
tara:strand:- start:414 stop:755 length:342 start_codon:yes stop_codon:yes gene_type:complete